MCDRHLGQAQGAKHRIDLASGGERLAHSAPYSAGPRVRDLEKFEIGRTLPMDVTKPAQAKYVTPILFVLKKDRPLRLCKDYRILDVLNF